MLSSFLFFAIFCSFVSAKLLPDVATCGQAVHSLDAGDMIKVQSTQFPKSLTSSQTSGNISCVITFTRNDGKNNGVQFIFTNGYTLGYLFDTPNGLLNPEGFGKKQQQKIPSLPNFYDSNRNIQFANAQNSSSLTYHYGITNVRMEWSAFEAFVYIPEDGEQMNSCWMNGKTFNLEDNTKTIPLFAKETTLQNCSWTINVPDEMAMKMTVPKFSTKTNGQVRLYPDGGDYISLGAGVSQVFNGKRFLVELLASGASKFVDDFDGFYALVSAVNKNPQTLTEFQCSKTDNGDHSNNYGFLDSQNGYPNSAFCKIPLPPVEAKKIMILQTQSRYMEYLGEWLQIHNAQNDIIGDLMEYDTFSAENVQNFNLQFVTDENVNGAGFAVREFIVDCTCAPSTVIVPCNGRYYAPIMQADLSTATGYHTYCRGMSCSYQFQVIDQCGDGKIEIDVDFQTPGLSFNDIVGVNVDGTEIWNSTEGNTFTGQFDQRQVVEFFFNSGEYKYEILNQISKILVTYSLGNQTTGSTIVPPTVPSTTTTMAPTTTTTMASTVAVTTQKTSLPPSPTTTPPPSPTTIPTVTTTTTTKTSMSPVTSSTMSSTTISSSSAAPSTTNPPNIFRITLTSVSPVVSIQLNSIKVFTQWIITAPAHQTLDLFISLDETNPTILQNYDLMDGIDAPIKLSAVPKTNDSRYPRMYTSKYGVLTISGSMPGAVTLFLRVREIHSLNCVDYKNVIQSNPGNSMDLSFQGSNSGNCLTTILAYNDEVPLVSLQNLSTTSDVPVFVVAGIDPNYVYLKFDKTTAASWNSVVLAGTYNSVIVPPKVTVKSECKVTNSKVQPIPKITAAQGIVYSLNYVMPGYSYNSQTPITVASLEQRKSSTTITCQFLDLGKDDFVQILQGKTTTMVTKVGQVIQLDDSQNINFVYKNTDSTKRGFLLEFKESPDMSGSANLVGFTLISMIISFLLL